MQYSVLVSPPAVEPITLAEAKAHLRVTHSAEDDLIDGLITAARQHAEEYTKRAFITQTWEVTLDAFPTGQIRLPRPPLQEVAEVAYTDGNGDEQTVASFTTRPHPVAPAIYPLYAAEWPIALDDVGAVRVTFTAGYGDDRGDVPAPIRQAIKLLVGHYYANREGVVTGTIATVLPLAVESLLGPYRVRVQP